jgi:hypothetical protein
MALFRDPVGSNDGGRVFRVAKPTRPRHGCGVVSVYSELVRMALEDDDSRDSSVSELVARLAMLRSGLESAGDPAARIGDAVYYDVTLVRLCERLRIDHDLTGDTAGPVARTRAESLLAGEVPSLAPLLAADRGR